MKSFVAFVSPDKIEGLPILLDYGPVLVVRADWGFDLEPPRDFDKELDVITLIELLGKLSLYLGVILNVILD